MATSITQSLVQVIVDGVKNFEETCAKRGVSYPTPDVLSSPETDTIQSELSHATAPIIAAAEQLVAVLTHPQPYLYGMSKWGYYTAALGVVEKGLVPDILREAGPKGLHVNDIAAINKLDPTKLAQTMRFLATKFIFEEIAPDVYRNSRMSSAICTGKPVKEMLEKPLERWDGTNGMAAIISLGGDESLKASANLVDVMFDPAISHSQEPNETALQRGLGTNLTMYGWMDKPENLEYFKKFQNGMKATANYSDDELISKGFDWNALPEGSVVVDVGGGIGSMTMALAQKYKHLKYVVEDRPAVVTEADGLWRTKMPGYLESGAVKLLAHDMFEKQPIEDAKVFMLRFVPHNWSDKYSVKLLRRLREAATPDTVIVLMEHIQDYLCRDASIVASVPGAYRPPAPEPLLPYPDTAIGFGYLLDMAMLGQLNCLERTLGQFLDLLRSSGWKLERIHRFESPLPQQMICVPA